MSLDSELAADALDRLDALAILVPEHLVVARQPDAPHELEDATRATPVGDDLLHAHRLLVADVRELAAQQVLALRVDRRARRRALAEASDRLQHLRVKGEAVVAHKLEFKAA